MTHGVPDSLLALAVPISSIRPYGKNAREGDLETLIESLRVHGQYKPIVVRRESNEILAGNHIFLAAHSLGWDLIAVTWISCTEDEAARIVLVDNRASDKAGYDPQKLVELLGFVADLEGTGFTERDFNSLLSALDPDEPVELTDVDDAPPVPVKPVTSLGDVWLLGPHRVLCGDATDAGAVAEMLAGVVPDCVWTDPPYGVNYVGKTSEALKIMNDSKAGLPALLLDAFKTIVALVRKGAPVYVAFSSSAAVTFELSMIEAGLSVRQHLVWVKNTLVLGHADYHYKHEPLMLAQTPGDSEIEDEHERILYGFAPGGAGRLGRGSANWFGDNKQTTVFMVDKPPRSAEHPTMKPVDLIVAMIKNSCPPGGWVLDLFGGSGSTLIAAHHNKSRAALVELDPHYVDVICRRYQEHTGVMPILASTGEPHDFTAGVEVE